MATAICSKCGAEHGFTPVPLLNTAKDPSVKERVRDGSLFIWECPCCGARNLLEFTTLYHDPDERFMVWLLPDGEIPALAAQAEGLENYTLRRVRDAGSLIEKVLIRDAALDDRVVELCKWITREELRQNNDDPALAGAPFKFFRSEGADNTLLFTYPSKGAMQVAEVGFHVYEDCRGILARNPSVETPPGFAEIDAAWLSRYF